MALEKLERELTALVQVERELTALVQIEREVSGEYLHCPQMTAYAVGTETLCKGHLIGLIS